MTPLDYLKCWVRPQAAASQAELKKDFTVFEKLTPSLREATNEFPLRLTSSSVWQAQRTFGEQATLVAMNWAAEAFVSKDEPDASPIYGKDVLL